ncbi:MAG: family 16 glycoside hydrolase [Bacteroidota bacterium]
MKFNATFLLFLSVGFAWCQTKISLENLEDFKEQIGNWQIVGDVKVNPNIDVHHLMEVPKEIETKKKKRKRKKEKEKILEPPKPVVAIPGKGILLNLNSPQKKDRLETRWQHGDIKLELEVMLPKGSNSGIYFQGRYELQLKDSWGVVHPKISDMGGIHNNWETDPGKIFRGIAPSSNAAKAPGLWQKLYVHFQAPKFDASGKKTANAKFVSVVLNGVQIHNNVEVPTYTGGPISKDESPKGPLVIQGDHGPVAFRNIAYSLLEESKVTLSNISYTTFKGALKGLGDLENSPIVSEGTSAQIDIGMVGEENEYGIVYRGTLEIPKNDTYNFSVGYTGGVRLQIDDSIVAEHNSAEARGVLDETISLSEGEHSLILTNIKSAPWHAPRLGLTVQTATTNPKVFHAYDSYPPQVSATSPIFVQPGAKPRLLRGFVSFKDSGKRLSHTIGVGTPEHINYVYDLGTANLVGVWRGPFVDATPMWHNRGNGSFLPKGAVQWTNLGFPLAELPALDSTFPENATAPDFVPKGYNLDNETGLPIFKYHFKGMPIEHRIIPDEHNKSLLCHLQFSDGAPNQVYYKLASGKVQKMADGFYAIKDREYYVKVTSAQSPLIRKVGEETDLIVPVDGNDITYEIVW